MAEELSAHALEIIEAAEYYTQKRGWFVVPCYGILRDENGKVLGCSCRKPTCKEKGWGKHPIGPGHFECRSPEESLDRVIQAARYDPNLNLAIFLGMSGLLVVDIDTGHKDASGAEVGIQNFVQLCADNGAEEPDYEKTPMQESGGGGTHLFFDVPLEFTMSKDVAEGVEFKNGRSLVHVYPSWHRSGKQYTWIVPPFQAGATPPAPPWMLQQVREGSAAAFEQKDEVILPEDLRQLGKRLARKNGETHIAGRNLLVLTEFDPQNTESIQKVQKVFDDGKRLSLLRISYELARAFPTIKAENVARPLKRAIDYREKNGAGTDFNGFLTMLLEDQRKVQKRYAGWYTELKRSQNGDVAACHGNVIIILKEHEDWKDVFGFDARSNKPMFMSKPPEPITPVSDSYPCEIREQDVSDIVHWFVRRLELGVSKEHVQDAVLSISHRREFDAVLDVFEQLVWDGVPRLDTFLIRHAGVADSPYARAATSRTLIGAVRRTYEPGAKHDTLLVLEGAQGARKSQLCRLLAFDDVHLFTDHLPDLKDKDAFVQLAGKLIVEISELSTIYRATAEQVKKFLSSSTDTYRPPYGRVALAFPRRCIFIGTTNDTNYLGDSTGNRRFLPLRCGDYIDLEGVGEELEQLWAEAIHRYKLGERSWFDHDEVALIDEAKAEQESRLEEDPFTDSLQEFFDKAHFVKELPNGPFTGMDTYIVGGFVRTSQLFEALKIEPKGRTSAISHRINHAMTRLGWRRHKREGIRGYFRDVPYSL